MELTSDTLYLQKNKKNVCFNMFQKPFQNGIHFKYFKNSWLCFERLTIFEIQSHQKKLVLNLIVVLF